MTRCKKVDTKFKLFSSSRFGYNSLWQTYRQTMRTNVSDETFWERNVISKQRVFQFCMKNSGANSESIHDTCSQWQKIRRSFRMILTDHPSQRLSKVPNLSSSSFSKLQTAFQQITGSQTTRLFRYHQVGIAGLMNN